MRILRTFALLFLASAAAAGGQDTFGTTDLVVTGGDSARASLYASVDARNRTVLVAINKTEAVLPLRVDLKDVPTFRSVEVYRLTSAQAKPVPQDEIPGKDPASLSIELPPLSISTLVLKP